MSNHIISAVLSLFDQLENSIRQIKEEDFKKPSSILNNSSIGQHVRHTLEFFLSLIDAKSSGKLDYDKRKHDTFIQEDKKLALSVLNSIREFISENAEDSKIELTVNYDLEQELTSIIASNFYRELAYNVEHAIHHMALIKIGIKDICPYVEVEEDFGVASSTIRYQKQLN